MTGYHLHIVISCAERKRVRKSPVTLKVAEISNNMFLTFKIPFLNFSCLFEWVWNLAFQIKRKLTGRLMVSENRVKGRCVGNRRQQQTGEYSIMTSFINSKHHHLYFERSDEGG